MEPFFGAAGSRFRPARALCLTGQCLTWPGTDADASAGSGQKMMAQNAVSSSRMLAPMVIMKPAARVLGSFTYARA